RKVEAVAVMECREQALRRLALRIQRTVGEEARPDQRDRLVETRGGVILDELDRAAAGEKRVDDVGLQRCDLGQVRLELDLRKRERQLLDDLAPARLERLLEAAHRFVA